MPELLITKHFYKTYVHLNYQPCIDINVDSNMLSETESIRYLG